MGALCRALGNPNNNGESKDTFVDIKSVCFSMNHYYSDVLIQYSMLIKQMKQKKDYIKHCMKQKLIHEVDRFDCFFLLSLISISFISFIYLYGFKLISGFSFNGIRS